LTNYLAILLAGGVVLLLVGLGRLTLNREGARVRQRGFVVFIVCLLLVSIPLSLSSYQQVVHAMESQKATSVVEQWLAGTQYQVVSVKSGDPIVFVTVEGDGELNPVQQLANQLASTLRRPILVTLRTVPAQIRASEGP
jgi:hypothetical protein